MNHKEEDKHKVIEENSGEGREKWEEGEEEEEEGAVAARTKSEQADMSQNHSSHCRMHRVQCAHGRVCPHVFLFVLPF
jgi:hypothetical protein